MDVRLSPEQEAFRNAAARLVDEFSARTVESLDDSERAAKLDAALAATSWREELPPIEAALVAEELGRGLADVAFVGPVLAADLRRRAGMPESSTPETIVLDDGVAFDARGCESAVAVVGSDAERALQPVAIGDARTAVDLTRMLAPTASTAREPLGALTDEAFVRWTALGLALTSADLVGVMSGATTLATEYAKARRQYGVPVGSFQAVQHLLADALVATEGSRSIARHAAWAVDALDAADALGAAAAAKAYCSRAARSVCETAIQVHGGIGNTWDCLAHVYLRRALLSIDAFGGVGPNLDRVLAHRAA
jgi:alkylation response protein AidB-like acyl-CoA dehydrogenase